MFPSSFAETLHCVLILKVYRERGRKRSSTPCACHWTCCVCCHGDLSGARPHPLLVMNWALIGGEVNKQKATRFVVYWNPHQKSIPKQTALPVDLKGLDSLMPISTLCLDRPSGMFSILLRPLQSVQIYTIMLVLEVDLGCGLNPQNISVGLPDSQ